jgi:hypothetical protein
LAGKIVRLIQSYEPQDDTNSTDTQLQHWRFTRKATLFDILNEDKYGQVIISIANTLHYSDVVSLSLTSKSINGVVFPHKPVKGRKERISIAACELGKTECWCCGAEICQVNIFLSHGNFVSLMREAALPA